MPMPHFSVEQDDKHWELYFPGEETNGSDS